MKFLESLLALRTIKTPYDREIFEAVIQAQEGSARNNESASKTVARIVADGSGSFAHTLCGAVLTTGGKHGPIGKARIALDTLTRETARTYASEGMKIPGFGNSFFKKRIDPEWEPVLSLVNDFYPTQAAQLESIRLGLQDAGKEVAPNAAGLSAAVCNATGLPFGIEDGLFIFPRINVWWDEFLKTLATN